MSTVTIIDTHTHVVSLDRETYPIEPPADLARMPWFDEHPVDAAGLVAAMDTAGVHGAVLVQAKGAYGFDNAYAADARAVAPDRLAGKPWTGSPILFSPGARGVPVGRFADRN